MNTIEKALSKHKQSQQEQTPEEAVRLTEVAVQPPAQDMTDVESAESREGTNRLGADELANDSALNRFKINLETLRSIGAVMPDDKRSKIKEEYKHIKQPLLQRASPDHGVNSNIIMITSAYSGEGKTFSSLNLALSIAVERDKRVLLVDADVVKPGLGRLLQIGEREGLVEYLNGDVKSLSDVMLRTNVNNLSILPAGSTHHLSHELLASNAMKQLANELSSRYPDRIIIFDAPPVLITSEAKVLSQLVGQIVMVVEQDRTSQSAVNDALAVLDRSRISGLILNKSRVSAGGYYGYYYGDNQ